MADDFSYLHAFLSGTSMAVSGFFTFVVKRFIDKVDTIETRQITHEKEDIGKYATIDQLTRVHDRIDAVQRSTEDGFRETRHGIGEIKNLLIGGAHSNGVDV